MAGYISAEVVCPFYRKTDYKACKIRCEGITQEGSVSIHFEDGDKLRAHIKRHCAAGYRDCLWAQALERGKYGK